MVDRRGRPRAPGGGRKRPVELSSSSAAPKRGEEAKSPSVPSHASTLPSQPSSSSSSSQTWRPAKVPIPRLVVPEGESGSSYGAQRDAAEKQRVRHACEPCRSRKTKCSGERPTCAHCLEHRIECRYGDGKRDRAKRELGNLQERVAAYERLLERLSLTSDGATKKLIQNALGEFTRSRGKGKSPAKPASRTRRGRGANDDDEDDDEGDDDDDDDDEDDEDDSSDASSGGAPASEDVAAAEVGSTGSADCIDDEIGLTDAETATEGFYGPSSATAWIRRLRQHLAAQSSGVNPAESVRNDGPMSMPLVLAGHDGSRSGQYHQHHHHHHHHHAVGDLQPPPLGLLDDHWLPPKPVADLLVNAFFGTVHYSFPMLLSGRFFAVYEQCFQMYDRPPTKRWRAILNLVFAIGALYSSLARAGWCGDREHQLFFVRARALALDDSIFWVVDDLEQVQVPGLAALYLIAAGHLERAWNVTGLAVRYAYSLGLHLRNGSDKLSDVEKEHRIRLWWSVYSIDCHLISMTGRPGAVEMVDVATPMPAPVPESSFPAEGGPLYGSVSRGNESVALSIALTSTSSSTSPSRSSSHGAQPSSRSRSSNHRRQPAALPEISLVTSGATYFLHRTRLATIEYHVFKSIYTAEAAQRPWADMQAAIAGCQAKLSRWRSELPSLLDFGKAHQDHEFVRERLILGLSYFSVLVLATRPGHCPTEDRIPSESEESKKRDHAIGVACVHAASDSLNMIPDSPNTAALYSVGPWWYFLHLLTQALSVLIIELSYRAKHGPQEAAGILARTKKGICWLWAMAEHSAAAEGAWTNLDDLLRQVAPMVGADVSDMPRLDRRAIAPFAGDFMPSFPAQAYQQHGVGGGHAGPLMYHQPEMGMPGRFGPEPAQSHSSMFLGPGQASLYTQDVSDLNLMYPPAGGMDDLDPIRPGAPGY